MSTRIRRLCWHRPHVMIPSEKGRVLKLQCTRASTTLIQDCRTPAVIRNRRAVPGWISYSYLRLIAFYTNFSIITTPEILVFLVNICLHFFIHCSCSYFSAEGILYSCRACVLALSQEAVRKTANWRFVSNEVGISLIDSYYCLLSRCFLSSRLVFQFDFVLVGGTTVPGMKYVVTFMYCFFATLCRLHTWFS